MKILAIDPGTLCGWALSQDGKIVSSGVWDLKGGRHEGGGMRFVRLRRYLNEIGDVDLCYYEEVRGHTGTDAAHIYGGIVATLTTWCESEPVIPYMGVPVGTIKKHATGKGNSGKPAMVKAANKKFLHGMSIITDDNEADALWLLDYAINALMH